MTEPENKCPFCSAAVESKIVERFGSVIAIEDKNPVTKGHLLVIPVRHVAAYFSMSSEEINDADKLIRILREKIEKTDSTVRGFNIGINCGESAGQTIMHAHIHLIPRRHGDTPEPKGGVRGVIPGKRKY
jgi:ATP adenylyltransferase